MPQKAFSSLPGSSYFEVLTSQSIMNKNYQLHLKSDFTEVEKVPDFVDRMSRETGLARNLKDRVLLALSEAVTNAIVHGNKEQTDKSVHVAVTVETSRVQMEVQDEGEGFDPSAIPDPTAEENLLAEGGRGLFLIETYADSIDYLDQGRLVRMVFRRK